MTSVVSQICLVSKHYFCGLLGCLLPVCSLLIICLQVWLLLVMVSHWFLWQAERRRSTSSLSGASMRGSKDLPTAPRYWTAARKWWTTCGSWRLTPMACSLAAMGVLGGSVPRLGNVTTHFRDSVCRLSQRLRLGFVDFTSNT